MERLKILFGICLVAVVLSDFLIPREHVTFFWDGVPGFSAIYGFMACVLIIVVSKFIGKRWLMKPEDYYD